MMRTNFYKRLSLNMKQNLDNQNKILTSNSQNHSLTNTMSLTMNTLEVRKSKMNSQGSNNRLIYLSINMKMKIYRQRYNKLN